jgi:1,4-dihydroxy-2-naphthoate polyprenyltransferase
LSPGAGPLAWRTVSTQEAQWKVWLAAMRPRTLPAAISPVVVGSALAWHAGAFHAAAAGFCLAFALLVQIGANFANDYYDFVRGADTGERVGPRRAVAAGLVAPATMKWAMWLVFGLAFASGLALVAWGGWWLVAIGAASILSGLAYTGGPYPLGYHGLGDVFVFVFFGLVAVGATFYVQVGWVNAGVVLAAVAIGGLATNILLVNNYRDAVTDAKAGKRTLVVRLGPRFARWQFASALGIAAATPVGLGAIGLFRMETGVVASLLSGACGFQLVRALHRAVTPADCIGLLGQSSGFLTGYALVLAGAIVAG